MNYPEEILSAIPHRPPFLYVDTIVQIEEDGIICRKTFQPDEYFFAGHYPDFPLVPGVILCESAMQAGAIYLSRLLKQEQSDSSDGNSSTDVKRVPVATRISDVKFKRMVRPGDTIEINVHLKEKMANAFFMSASVSVGGKNAVRLDFACALNEIE